MPLFSSGLSREERTELSQFVQQLNQLNSLQVSWFDSTVTRSDGPVMKLYRAAKPAEGTSEGWITARLTDLIESRRLLTDYLTHMSAIEAALGTFDAKPWFPQEVARAHDEARRFLKEGRDYIESSLMATLSEPLTSSERPSQVNAKRLVSSVDALTTMIEPFRTRT